MPAALTLTRRPNPRYGKKASRSPAARTCSASPFGCWIWPKTAALQRKSETGAGGSNSSHPRRARRRAAQPPPAAIPGAAPSQSVDFEKGLVSERQIAVLPEGALVEAGPRVRFTPLALDEINRRGIRLKRRKA